MTFDAFFKRAMTGTADLAHQDGLEPFDYQRRLACGERIGRGHAEWVSSGSDCRSLLVNIPTGCGKTAALVLAWLWNRLWLQLPDWPRRLVYCLPMRVLVEQTRDNVRRWLDALREQGSALGPAAADDLAWLVKNSPVVLMGGEEDLPKPDEWDLHPEREAIIIGTQDMLLSRALNRGYAASRARWPMQFGLLHTDCLWVFDEVQLMGAGLATTAQLEAFRRLLESQDGHNSRSVWMSATMQINWLKTVDFDPGKLGEPLGLEKEDFEIEEVKRRWKAKKPLTKARAGMGDATDLAQEIRKTHRVGTRTIVIVNTVRRARELFEALAKLVDAGTPKGHKPKKRGTEAAASATTAPRVVLLHSRFRPGDRLKAIEAALGTPPAEGTIVVSTQVIEAGVDVSAATLFTELAPWASLVQRFGRCNRRGEVGDGAAVRWIDLPEKDGELTKIAAPYELGQLKDSAKRLRKLGDVGLGSLPEVELPFDRTHVIRRTDLVDLFDTTPDLTGNDIDIDRFVRDVEETDVRVFWSDWFQPNGSEPPPEDEPAPEPQELCPAPVGEFRQFAHDQKRKGKVWRWNFLDGEWERVDPKKVVPGHVFLVHASAGGYSIERGWDATRTEGVDPVVTEGARTGEPADATDADGASQIGIWQTIAQHTDDVCGELDAILDGLRGDDAQTSALRLAARWHDRGKAHEVFQNAVDDGQQVRRRDKMIERRERPDGWRGCRFVAKAPEKRKDSTGVVVVPGFWRQYERKHFRHELASALVVLDSRITQIPNDLRDLIAYIVAAHHGKVRLSIRSLPNETRPRDAERHPQPMKRFARGVWDGDRLPDTDLGGGVIAPAAVLSLEPMELGLCVDEPFAGQPSWGARIIRLRDSLGPFKLAYLEMLLRAADMRASRVADRRAAAPANRKQAPNV